jgi:hypothetical protein
MPEARGQEFSSDVITSQDGYGLGGSDLDVSRLLSQRKPGRALEARSKPDPFVCAVVSTLVGIFGLGVSCKAIDYLVENYEGARQVVDRITQAGW